MSFFDDLQNATQTERQQLYQVPLVVDGVAGRLSRETYIAYLTEAYHHVKHTVPLLMTAASRLPDEKNWVRKAYAEYIEEEIGHEEWILGDISESGGDAAAARAQGPSFATEMMVAYAYDMVSRRNPVAFLGMVFVLEGTSINLATLAAEALQSSLGLPRAAFTYLLSHGALDQEHMKFFESLVNQITDPQDQRDIIHMAKVMFRLFADVFRSIPHQTMSALTKEAALCN
jgi:pyrroloquinoline quinone (PQQ) biosynthesis protein C